MKAATIGRMLDLALRPSRPFFFIFIAAITTVAASPAPAQAGDFNIFADPGYWRLELSPYTGHFRPSPEHRPVYALGIERQRNDGRFVGAAYFRNSFGQPSAYVYLGERYSNLFGDPQFFAQWSAGVLYGYKGKWKNKVPLNYNGFSPGAVVSAGWQFNERVSADLNLLGDAGIMLQFSVKLP